jgi:hypothetical protein
LRGTKHPSEANGALANLTIKSKPYKSLERI